MLKAKRLNVIKNKLWKIIFVSVIGLGLGVWAYIKDEIKPQPEDGLTSDEIKFLEEFEEVLHGGRPANPGELLASVSIGNCTGTIVGPNVLLTAAHCRSTGSTISFSLKGQTHRGTCQRHPEYSQGAWLNNDFALCQFSPAAILDVYGDLAPRSSKVGDRVTMQGYGQGSGGRLNHGIAIIARINWMDIITSGNVRLGGGDSGGALFKEVKDLVRGSLQIIGVNSRGNSTSSLFNITALARSQSFFKDYARAKKVAICGVSWDCAPAEPPVCAEYEDLLSRIDEELYHARKIKDVCLAHEESEADRVLIGGRVVEPGEFDEVVRITIGNSSCTATFVAENVLVSAAHCGSHRSRVRTSYLGQAVQGTCYHHPAYPARDVDVMLCKLDRAYDVKPASIFPSPQIGDVVTLVGYGCTQPGGGGSDGRNRVGNATVTAFSAFDIVSRQGAALCFGDSGGPMFQRLFDPRSEPKKIIGVNSKGNIRDTNWNLNLGLSIVQDFLKDFEKVHDVKLCGVSKECITQKPKYCADELQQIDHLQGIKNRFEKMLEQCKLQ
jgi:V8-like Glu-specific endopeptidase